MYPLVGCPLPAVSASQNETCHNTFAQTLCVASEHGDAREGDQEDVFQGHPSARESPRALVCEATLNAALGMFSLPALCCFFSLRRLQERHFFAPWLAAWYFTPWEWFSCCTIQRFWRSVVAKRRGSKAQPPSRNIVKRISSLPQSEWLEGDLIPRQLHLLFSRQLHLLFRPAKNGAVEPEAGKEDSETRHITPVAKHRTSTASKVPQPVVIHSTHD